METKRARDPHPRKRIDAVRALNEAGIPLRPHAAPILPGITDDLGSSARWSPPRSTPAPPTSPDPSPPAACVREEFLPWLEDNYPDLVGRYEELYRRPYA